MAYMYRFRLKTIHFGHNHLYFLMANALNYISICEFRID